MGHTFHRNYGHIVFHVASTPMRTDDLPRVHGYMREILHQFGVYNPLVGGVENHIHILGEFPVCKAASDIVRVVKTSTTMWLKRCRTGYANFEWQGGFAYFSISATHYRRVMSYILHQRERHAKISPDEEMREMIALCDSDADS